MNEDGIAFDHLLAALRRIARGEVDPGLEARAVLAEIGEDWKHTPAPVCVTQEDIDEWVEELRREEDAGIIAEIEAEEELAWFEDDDKEAELLGLDRESYDAFMHALMKND